MYFCRSLNYLTSIGYSFEVLESKRCSFTHYLDKGILRWDSKECIAYFKRYKGRSKFYGFSKEHTKNECSDFDKDMDRKIAYEIECNNTSSKYMRLLCSYAAIAISRTILLILAILMIFNGIIGEHIEIVIYGLITGVFFNLFYFWGDLVFPRDQVDI